MTDQRRIRVLVADHDRWTRLSVAAMLSEAGFAVDQASNGMSALRMAAADAPHIVLIAQDLPEVTPADVVTSVRNDPRMRHTAVVQVREAGNPWLLSEVRLDVDGRLEMPCNPIELLATMLNALEARDAQPMSKGEGRVHERPQTGTRQAIPVRVSPQRSHQR